MPLEARVFGEFHETFGLSLTAEQAARLFCLPHSMCVQLLQNLVARGLLQRKGALYRLGDGRP